MGYSLWNTIQHYGYCNMLCQPTGGEGVAFRPTAATGTYLPAKPKMANELPFP